MSQLSFGLVIAVSGVVAIIAFMVVRVMAVRSRKRQRPSEQRPSEPGERRRMTCDRGVALLAPRLAEGNWRMAQANLEEAVKLGKGCCQHGFVPLDYRWEDISHEAVEAFCKMAAATGLEVWHRSTPDKPGTPERWDVYLVWDHASCPADPSSEGFQRWPSRGNG